MNELLLNNESPVDNERIEALVRTLDLRDEHLVRYGSNIQERYAKLADRMLRSVMELSPERIDKLVSEIRTIVEENDIRKSNTSLSGLLRLMPRKDRALRAQHEKALQHLDEKARELNGQRMKVLVNLEVLDDLYRQNLECYDDLECHILAGKQKLQEAQAGDLEVLRQKVEKSGGSKDVAEYNFLRDRVETLEERICSLETTKTMSTQLTVQIRLARGSNEQLIQQISGGDSLVSAWKQNVAMDDE